MDTRKMLYQMCHEVFSGTDMRAICKSRGFPVEAKQSKALLEGIFLSDAGVQAALATLTTEEVALFHLLNLTGGMVDIQFFARLYGDEKSSKRYSRTFTQRYNDVFKKVQRSLVRKGVLLVAQVGRADTKMERWRFRFPKEFAPFLPPLFPAAEDRVLEGAGDSNQKVLRQKIAQFLQKSDASESQGHKEYEVRLAKGQLYIGKKPFRTKYLWEWQQRKWQASMPSIYSDTHNLKNVSATDFVSYAFAQLQPNEWLLPNELSVLLEMFYHETKAPDASAVCEKGWEWGCLAKQEIGTRAYYRPAPAALRGYAPFSSDGKEGGTASMPSEESALSPKRYLQRQDSGSVIIDLQTIPYKALEYMAQIANLEVLNGDLSASASLAKLGNASEHVRKQALGLWLREHVPDFGKVMKRVDQRWGKEIVHQNLLVARIKDLSLKVRLERAFANPKQLVVLSNEFVAFPRDLLPEVQKIVKKTDNVIKTVKTKE